MPGADHAGRNPPLHGRRQFEQPDGVGNLWSGTFDAISQLLLRAAKVLQHLLVRGSLFERIELNAMEIFQERIAE